MSIFFQSLKVKYIGKFWQNFKNFEIYTGLFRHSKQTFRTIKNLTLILREAGKIHMPSQTQRLTILKNHLKNVRKNIIIEHHCVILCHIKITIEIFSRKISQKLIKIHHNKTLMLFCD